MREMRSHHLLAGDEFDGAVVVFADMTTDRVPVELAGELRWER